jgi:hypothetical protein
VELFPDLSTLSDQDLERMLVELERQEDAISQRRRILHGRIDILRAERVVRIKAKVDGGALSLPAEDATAEHLERPIFHGTGDLPEEAPIEPMPDLGTLDDEELRVMIAQLEHDEDDVSLERRVIHGRIDILRAERSRRRHGGVWDPDSLAEVLSRGTVAPSTDGA